MGAAKQIRTVAVFCGSRFGKRPIYREHAERLGTLLGQNGFNLIYGGGQAGLMGVVSAAAHLSGSKVLGVMAEAFTKSAHYSPPEGPEQVLVKHLHQRKREMLRRSDAVIVLPGGIDTLDEKWEGAAMIDMNVTALSNLYVKPVIVLNTAGLYDDSKRQMLKQIREGFIHPGREKILRMVDTPEQVIEKLHTWNREGIMRAADIIKAIKIADPEPQL